jgi:hypothetical protein
VTVKPPKFNTVGQKVIHVPAHRGEPYETEITRVGTKYAYIGTGWRETKFGKWDGVEQTNYASDRIWIPEEYAAHVRAGELRDLLRKEYDVTVNGSWSRASKNSIYENVEALEGVLAAIVAALQ